jgi:outer membrane immunogenic protein
MKKFLLATVAVIALGTVSASAADISRRVVAPARTSTTVVEQSYNWTGPYVGLVGGYGWGSSAYSAPLSSGSFDLSGGTVGGTLGYNWQMGPAVVGLEGDISWSNIRGSGACGGLSCSTRNSWLGTARGRLGYAAGNWMPYVTGGFAFGDIKTSVSGFNDTTSTKTGYALGAGLEAALSGPWTAKIEYLYVDLGRGGSIAGSDASFKTNIVRAGLNYRF